MFDRLSDGEAQAPAGQHHGSGMPQELSSGERPEAASILPHNTSPGAGSGSLTNRLKPSGKGHPCPICTRQKDGDCRISDDLVLCHHGSSHHPPQHLKRGEVITGSDGQQWAFTGDTSDGRAATYTLHRPRQNHRPAPATPAVGIQIAQLPKPASEPPQHWPHGTRLPYSDQQTVVVLNDEKGKRHIPHHRNASGRETTGAGPQPWPLWHEAEVIEHGPGRWIIETEGEKCAEWVRAAGRIGTTQPGPDHKIESIEARYRRLHLAGVVGIVYLADNDKTGREKAEKCQRAAAAAGLHFRPLHAAEVWPGICSGGSIDDAPGSATDRVAAVVSAAQAWKPTPSPAPATTKAQQAPAPQLLSLDAVRQQLREAIADGIGGSDLAALITELADAADRPHTTVQRLADAIRAEQLQSAAVAAEARQLAAEADRRELGQMLTPAYLLPPAIAGAIETRSRYLPCDGPSAVLPFLAAAAGLVKLGTEVEGSAVAGYRVPVNLFACLVGRSGAKKSPIGRLLVEAPTAELRADLARANQRDREAWEEACRETKKGEAKPSEPRPKRLMVSDFTGEALAAQLQTQEAAGLGLLVNRDELSGLFGSLNQYRGGRGADEQQLLELFDGSGLSSLRIVGDRHYNRSQLSIWGSTQPDVLRQLVAGGDASGLWARFLFVPLPERVVPLPMNTTPAEVAEVEAAAQTLADACAAIYRLPRQTYRLAPGAAAAFGRYELQRQQAALSATIGAQSALYGKSAGKVLRVAGVLHLLQIAAGVINTDAAIGEGTIERAAALVDHLDAWALSLHAEAAAGGVAGLMRTVHKAAEEAGGTIRWKELAMKLSAKARRETDGAAFAQAARALEEAGYGEVETGQRGSIRYRATGRLP